MEQRRLMFHTKRPMFQVSGTAQTRTNRGMLHMFHMFHTTAPVRVTRTSAHHAHHAHPHVRASLSRTYPFRLEHMEHMEHRPIPKAFQRSIAWNIGKGYGT
jgi:hypothetical protein